MTNAEKLTLAKHACHIRMGVIEGTHSAKCGHPGGSLDIAEVLSYLYFVDMNIDPKEPKKPDRDRFVLSKGHAAPALYATLAERGFFPVEDLKTLRKIGSYLQGHPNMNETPGVDMSTGSLGQGVSAACGMALGAKHSGKPINVYTILGDGEVEEGECWEAFMFAAHYKLSNLCVMLDRNHLQIDGTTETVMNSAPLEEKLKALVTDGVEYAKQADMYVIVDWHILHDSNPLTHKAEALQFFKEMTEKLKGEKHVLYEICNEPNSGCSWEDIKTYANEVIPVIRENAPEAVILVGTPTWSQEIEKPQNDSITGYDNIMYTLHFYAATHKEDLRSKMVNAVEAGTPVFVSEYGLCDASGNGGNDLGQAQSWIDTMDQHGISYAVWSFCNKEETSALIASSCRKTSDFTREDLSESGKWIMDMLHTVKTEDGSTQTVVDSKDKTQNQNKGSGVSERTEADETEGKTGTDVSEKRLNSGNLSVDAKLTGSWESEGRTFYQYQLTITNNGEADVSSWEISLQFSDTITLSDGWNGEYQADGSTLTIHSLDYNSEIEKGASTADVGFIVSATGTLEIE